MSTLAEWVETCLIRHLRPLAWAAAMKVPARFGAGCVSQQPAQYRPQVKAPVESVLELRQVALRVVAQLEAFEGRGHPGLQVSQGRVHCQEARVLAADLPVLFTTMG